MTAGLEVFMNDPDTVFGVLTREGWGQIKVVTTSSVIECETTGAEARTALDGVEERTLTIQGGLG